MIIIITAWFFSMVIAATLNVLWEATAALHRFEEDFFFPVSGKKNFDN